MAITLYGFWRSSCSWRVRIALEYKELPYNSLSIHLQRDGGQQFTPEHKHRNQMAQVPVLKVGEIDTGDVYISQSLAIMEYLEERYPEPSIFPEGLNSKTRARQIAEIINSGIQPLQNSSTIRAISALGHDKKEWARSWIQQGLDNLEQMVQQMPKTKFLVCDTPTVADFCLVPQMYNARRFGCKISKWSELLRVEAKCLELSAFLNSHPDNQKDAEKSL